MKNLIVLLTLFSAATAAADYCDSDSDTEQSLCDQANEIRSSYNVDLLTEDSQLDAMAEDYASQLSDYGDLTHNIPGHEFKVRMAQGGVALPCAENIATGQENVAEVMSDWEASPGHFKNMTGAAYNRVGSGYYNGYWVQIFSH